MLGMPGSRPGYRQAVSTNARLMSATPAQVWAVLADGWLYPLWVVGASRTREVDDTWPQSGARLHHSVGVWPLLLDDITEVVECRPGSLLELQAHAWPAGRADVRIHLRPQGRDTEVVIEENATKGPAALIPNAVEDPLLKWRNVETLRRLAFLAERRHQPVA
jgi:hypothetical protein